MTELKTLKDLGYYEDNYVGDKRLVSYDELKAEAVKWVKREIKLLSNNNKEAESILFKWMDFFNLTEEDLEAQNE